MHSNHKHSKQPTIKNFISILGAKKKITRPIRNKKKRKRPKNEQKMSDGIKKDVHKMKHDAQKQKHVQKSSENELL